MENLNALDPHAVTEVDAPPDNAPSHNTTPPRTPLMATIRQLADALVGILEQPSQRKERVRAFQDLVLDDISDSPPTPREVLTSLAMDLEFYIADGSPRKQSAVYFGDQHLRQEVLKAIRFLVDANVVPTDVLARASAAAPIP